MSKEKIITDSALKYIDGKGNSLQSRTELSVAKLLQFLGIDYEYNSNLTLNNGLIVSVDFKTKNGLIEVIDDEKDALKLKHISTDNNNGRIIAIGNSGQVGRVSELNSPFCYDNSTSDIRSIFIEDPTLNFDYAHILPLVERCSVLHGHTSSVMVEIIGSAKNGMVMDFGDAKRVVKQALDTIDHKFFINRRYLVGEDDEHYNISFLGPKGTFDIKIPKDTAYMLNDEGTAENLASELVKIISDKMPQNVQALGVYVYEGVGKGAHVVAKINDKA